MFKVNGSCASIMDLSLRFHPRKSKRSRICPLPHFAQRVNGQNGTKMGLAEAAGGHWENNQRAQTSSHDPIWFLRGTICSEHAVLVPINNMHTICVFVGQIRPQHDSRLVLTLAALSKMTENCGWIGLSCRQYEIGCPPAVRNVVNLCFCGCYSPT